MFKKAFSYSVVVCSVVTGIVVSSCNHTDKQEVANNRVFADYHYALDSVIKSTSGILSGIELGQSVKLIPAREVNQAVEKANDHITFEQKIDSISKYTITYSFENDTITEMEVLITSQNGDEGDKIMGDLKSYYAKKYTAPIMDKGYFVFNCFDSKKQNFTITLTDNSGASNSVIDMYVYREK
ncbi:MAG TPA: hypothetical protein VN698_08635 [Bacteroidia bacterium]|nr:hypothetical protein [Bacteroidia bacterium]